jgi:hypothetical protein
MSDPFAPPSTPDPAPTGRVFRAGDVLVVPMGRPEWPDRCVRCGAPATERAAEIFAHSPRISWFIAVFAGVVVGQATRWPVLALLAMALVVWVPSTVRTLQVPACAQHRPGIVVARVLYLASLAMFGALILPLGDYPKVAVVLVALVGVVTAVVLGSRLSTQAIADGYVQIRGAHPGLLALVPDVESRLRR